MTRASDTSSRVGLEPEQIVVLALVDLDLEIQLRIGRRFGGEAEDEMRRMACTIPVAVSEPYQCLADRVDRRADARGIKPLPRSAH
jgi:hypothetical protein